MPDREITDQTAKAEEFCVRPYRRRHPVQEVEKRGVMVWTCSLCKKQVACDEVPDEWFLIETGTVCDSCRYLILEKLNAYCY